MPPMQDRLRSVLLMVRQREGVVQNPYSEVAYRVARPDMTATQQWHP